MILFSKRLSDQKAPQGLKLLTSLFLSIFLTVFLLSPLLANPLSVSADSVRLFDLKRQLTHWVKHTSGKVGITVTDLSSDHTIEIGASTTPMNPASVIKVTIMAETFRQRERGLLKFSDRLILRRQDREYGSGPLCYAPAGTAWDIEHLVELMIQESDNTATQMLINHLGIANINLSMKKWGMYQTKIGTSNLLEADNINVSTAHDTNGLLTKIATGQIVSSKACEEMITIMSGQTHRWGIPRFIPAGIRVANKTGTLHHVKHDCAVVCLKQHPYTITIFTQDLPWGSHRVLLPRISQMVYEWADEAYTASTPYHQHGTLSALRKHESRSIL